jgi:hypothetical protein
LYWGETRVNIDARQAVDLTNVVITMQRASKLSGVVKTENNEDLPPVTISADPADGDPSMGRPWGTLSRGSSTFTLDGLLPSRYMLRALAGSGMVVKSAVWNGVDYSDLPFVATNPGDITGVVLTLAKGGTVKGTVTDARGASSSTAIVVYFPADPTKWRHFGIESPRLGRVLVNSAGMYTTPPLPAGEYFLAALETDDSLTGGWQDPGFLRTLSARASRIRVEWNSPLLHDLRVAQVGR